MFFNDCIASMSIDTAVILPLGSNAAKNNQDKGNQ
jgi:hypothetical protein